MAKILTLLVLLCLTVSGASADPQEELLTTVTATGLTTYTQTVEGIVTVTPNASDYYASGGWYYMGSVTVEPVSDEYTITRCVFIDPYESLEDDLAPFIVSMYDNTVSVETKNGVASKDMSIKTIEVYGYKNSAEPAGPTDYYLVGNMTSWEIDPQYKLALNESAGDANEYQIALALPAATELKVVSSTDGTTIKDWFPGGQGNDKYVQNDGLYTIYFRPGYNGGDDWHAGCIYVADGVSFTANGEAWTLAQMPACDVEMEVEYFPLATLATLPAAAEGVVEGTDAALLTPGTSAEGTLAYAIGTSEAPTGQWSDAIPTTQGLEAGTCYVWYKVVGDAEHSDSQPQSIPVTIAALPAYAVTIDDAGVDASNWQATPAEPKTGQTVTLSYSGKKKIRSITIEAAPAAGLTSYTLAESTVGMIVGTNGLAYAVEDKDNLPDGVTVAGVVVYKNGANGLAIALTDEASMMDWATACGESGAAAHTPTVEGQTWKLPSQDEWTLVKNAHSASSLNSAITSAGGTAIPTPHFDPETMTMTGQYWLSTENGSDLARIWAINGYDEIVVSNADQDLKTSNNLVRACLAW